MSSSTFRDFFFTGCRGHPCPRRCGTHGGFRIKSSDLPFPELARLLRRRLLVVQHALAVRAEVDLQMLLDLVVQLWRQTHPASLAGPAFRQRNRDARATAEDHLVAR